MTPNFEGFLLMGGAGGGGRGFTHLWGMEPIPPQVKALFLT